MPMSKNPAAYKDIERVLNTVMDYDSFPAEYQLSSNAAANTWRQRANGFRQALRKQEERNFDLPEGQGTSIYDHLIFKLAKGSATVVIDLLEQDGSLKIDGKLVRPEEEQFIPTNNDDLDLEIE